jgi:hypothetical protein
VVHFCLDGNSCAGLKGLCPSPGIKYYADGNSCAPGILVSFILTFAVATPQHKINVYV